MTVYDFDTQKKVGKEGEDKLDAYFRQWFDISPSTPDEQRREIDRHFSPQGHPEVIWTVEYKYEPKGDKTGNLFPELISCDKTGALGWGVYCASNLLIDHIPSGNAWVLVPGLVRLFLPLWMMQYPVKPSDNGGYKSYGVPVPQDVIAASPCCLMVVDINKPGFAPVKVKPPPAQKMLFPVY